MDKLKRLLENRKKTYVEKTPNDVYQNVGHNTNLTADDVASIGGVESQHGEFDKPIKGGSARGLFQFQPKTAEHLDPGSSENLEDLDTQEKLMELYLQKNKAENAEDGFVKHNLGPSRGSKFLMAPDDTSIRDVIPENVINANPGLYDVKTIGEARQRIKEKLLRGRESSDVRPNFLDLFKGKK